MRTCEAQAAFRLAVRTGPRVIRVINIIRVIRVVRVIRVIRVIRDPAARRPC